MAEDPTVEPLAAGAVKQRIAEGQERRKLMKTAVHKRLVGGVRHYLAALVLQAAVVTASTASAVCSTAAGPGKPDIVEIFGGHCEVSYQA
eukprot:961808-Lingulodinium_polyedra.AAC.1